MRNFFLPFQQGSHFLVSWSPVTVQFQWVWQIGLLFTALHGPCDDSKHEKQKKDGLSLTCDWLLSGIPVVMAGHWHHCCPQACWSEKYYFDYFLEPFSITLRPLRYTTVVQIESQGLNSAYAVQKILKSFGDIGRCNCWPKMSKVFKIKLPFLGAKCALEEFWRNLGHIPPFSARQPWFLVF